VADKKPVEYKKTEQVSVGGVVSYHAGNNDLVKRAKCSSNSKEETSEVPEAVKRALEHSHGKNEKPAVSNPQSENKKPAAPKKSKSFYHVDYTDINLESKMGRHTEKKIRRAMNTKDEIEILGYDDFHTHSCYYSWEYIVLVLMCIIAPAHIILNLINHNYRPVIIIPVIMVSLIVFWYNSHNILELIYKLTKHSEIIYYIPRIYPCSIKFKAGDEIFEGTIYHYENFSLEEVYKEREAKAAVDKAWREERRIFNESVQRLIDASLKLLKAFDEENGREYAEEVGVCALIELTFENFDCDIDDLDCCLHRLCNAMKKAGYNVPVDRYMNKYKKKKAHAAYEKSMREAARVQRVPMPDSSMYTCASKWSRDRLESMCRSDEIAYGIQSAYDDPGRGELDVYGLYSCMDYEGNFSSIDSSNERYKSLLRTAEARTAADVALGYNTKYRDVDFFRSALACEKDRYNRNGTGYSYVEKAEADLRIAEMADGLIKSGIVPQRRY